MLSERSVTGKVYYAHAAWTDETHQNLLTNLTEWSVLTLFTTFVAAGLLRAFRYRCDGTYCSKNNGLSRATCLAASPTVAGTRMRTVKLLKRKLTTCIWNAPEVIRVSTNRCIV